MQKIKIATYEIFMKNGTSFLLENVEGLSLEFENREIIKLDIRGDDDRDKLVFINISDINCIIKRKEKTKRLWKK